MLTEDTEEDLIEVEELNARPALYFKTTSRHPFTQEHYETEPSSVSEWKQCRKCEVLQLKLDSTQQALFAKQTNKKPTYQMKMERLLSEVS